MRLPPLPLILAFLAGAAAADTGTPSATTMDKSAPSATTATYGNWTVGCSAATGADGAAVRICEMTTRLNVKGQDGQLRPLLQMSVGQPPGAQALRLALQVPTDVALRAGVTLSFDKPGDAAKGDPAGVKPQEDVLALTYLACNPAGCLADSDEGAQLWPRLQQEKTLNVAFTLLAGAKKVVVPVSLDGFGAAFEALQTDLK